MRILGVQKSVPLFMGVGERLQDETDVLLFHYGSGTRAYHALRGKIRAGEGVQPAVSGEYPSAPWRPQGGHMAFMCNVMVPPGFLPYGTYIAIPDGSELLGELEPFGMFADAGPMDRTVTVAYEEYCALHHQLDDAKREIRGLKRRREHEIALFGRFLRAMVGDQAGVKMLDIFEKQALSAPSARRPDSATEDNHQEGEEDANG